MAAEGSNRLHVESAQNSSVCFVSFTTQETEAQRDLLTFSGKYNPEMEYFPSSSLVLYSSHCIKHPD